MAPPSSVLGLIPRSVSKPAKLPSRHQSHENPERQASPAKTRTTFQTLPMEIQQQIFTDLLTPLVPTNPRVEQHLVFSQKCNVLIPAAVLAFATQLDALISPQSGFTTRAPLIRPVELIQKAVKADRDQLQQRYDALDKNMGKNPGLRVYLHQIKKRRFERRLEVLDSFLEMVGRFLDGETVLPEGVLEEMVYGGQ